LGILKTAFIQTALPPLKRGENFKMVNQKTINGGILLTLLALLVMGVMFGGQVADSLNALQPSTNADVDQNDVSASVSYPTSPTNPKVVFFNEEPEDFGNYVDFSASDAKSGLQAGVDYSETTSADSDNKATISDVDSGTYYAYVDADNYQPSFVEVTMPEQVDKEIYVTNSNAYKLVGKQDLRTTESIKSDNVVSYDDSGSVLATGSDLPDASSNGVQTVEFVREVQVDTGTALLGAFDVTSFNENDGIEKVDVNVDMGGETYSKELKDGSTGELADSTSFGDDLVSDAETSPAEVAGTVTVTYTLEIERGTGTASADDGVLQTDESIFTGALDDIFGNDFGSSATVSYTG